MATVRVASALTATTLCSLALLSSTVLRPRPVDRLQYYTPYHTTTIMHAPLHSRRPPLLRSSAPLLRHSTAPRGSMRVRKHTSVAIRRRLSVRSKRVSVDVAGDYSNQRPALMLLVGLMPMLLADSMPQTQPEAEVGYIVYRSLPRL